jgi:hypothetical protein
MVKLLITTLTMIFMSFGASAYTANSYNIETLYKYCKPYQNNRFIFKGLDRYQIENAIDCTAYVKGLIDLGYKNCLYLRQVYKEKGIRMTASQILSDFIANETNVSINVVIKTFIKYAENNLKVWKYSPFNYTNVFLSKNYPRKIY